jgi:hypothetical protein
MIWKRILVVLVAVFALIQLVPYGRSHRNPPAGTPPPWDSPLTEELARRACFDCHSNETRWPWYSSVAPLSWRIQRHVDEGREKLNVSAFSAAQEEAGESAESVREGKMPPWDYALAHPEARLSEAEKTALARGLALTFGEAKSEGRGGAEEKDDD